MSEAMLFNEVQGIVLDDIARFWKAEKHGDAAPCIFFVDIRGEGFHVKYSNDKSGAERRDTDFSKLMEKV